MWCELTFVPKIDPATARAARPDAKVAIATLTFEPGARVALPAVDDDVTRVLYFFGGTTLTVDGKQVAVKHAIQIGPGAIELVAGADACDVLLLQGRPIGEPVAQHGPFVMNSRQEIQQAYADYQRTRFGGWPWPSSDPVHPRERGRFARHADGRVEDAPPDGE